MKSIYTILLCLALLPFTAEAKDGKKQRNKAQKEATEENGFEKQARAYARRSRITGKQAEKATDPYVKERLQKISQNLKFMSDSKREALAAQEKGKKYNWKEYQSVQQENKKHFQELKKYRAQNGDKAGPAKTEKAELASEKKDMKGQKAEKKAMAAKSATEKAESKPMSKTFKTADGFMIRTSL